MSGSGWQFSTYQGAPADFHALPIPQPATRAAWIFEATVPTVVLGSAQDASVLDDDAVAASGLTVTRRRSGGGAVLLEPGGVVWVDVIVPNGDELWDPDVGRASWWLGACWRQALSQLDVDATVHHGPLQHGDWSRLVCFGGLGSGEVTVAGRKIVGISQRRTREAARFQCAALCRWQPDRLIDVLALDADERRIAAADLRGRAVGLEQLIGPTAPANGGRVLLDAFVAALQET